MAEQDDERRALTLALNESAHRNTNERVMRPLSSRGLAPTQPVPLVCECGAPICREIVMLSSEEYEHVRAHPTWFLVAPGHEDEDPTRERVVGAGKAYVVVEKIGSAGEEAARRYPRDHSAQ